MAKCPPTVEQQQVGNLHASNRIKVLAAYDKVFRSDYGLNDNAIDYLNTTLGKRKLELRKLEKESLPNAKKSKNFTLKAQIQKRIKSLKGSIKEIQIEIQDNKGKRQILDRLQNIMQGHVLELLDEQTMQGLGFEVNPEILFNIMKDSIIVPRTMPEFDKLSDLSKGDLISVERQLGRDLLKLKEMSQALSKEGGYKLSWWVNDLMHPAAVARKMDPTGNSYKPIESSLKLAERAYTVRAKYEDLLSKLESNILDLVTGMAGGTSDAQRGTSPYLFLMDPISKADETDRGQSTQNIFKTIHELGDGELARIVPTTIMDIGADGNLQFNSAFTDVNPDTGKSDQQVWTELVKANVNNKINMNGWIQEYVHKVGDKSITYYYVMIKHVDPATNAEYYRAYEAPYKTSKQGNDILQFPPTTGPANVAFYKDWYTRRNASETIAGIRRFNRNTKTWDVEEGIMPAGWYRASGYGNVTGNKGTDKEFKAQTYKEYKLDPIFNSWEAEYQKAGSEFAENSSFGIHHDIWNALQETRSMFRDVADDIASENNAYEERLLSMLNKALPDLGIKSMSKQNINQILKDQYGLDVDTLDMNIVVRGDGPYRTIYTANTQFSELENYMPRMYLPVDMIVNLLKAREHMKARLDSKNTELSSKIGSADPSDMKRVSKLKREIKEMTKVLDYYQFNSDLQLGLGRGENSSFNQVTSIKAAKHRSEFSNPLEVREPVEINGTVTERITNNGRRKDGGVFHDYLENTFISIEQNKLKLDLLEGVIGGMPDAIKEYTVDQVKAALGRDDINASIFNFDYSDSRWDLTDSNVGYLLELHNKLVSANLLKGMGVSMTNNMQRIGYSIVSDLGVMEEARSWRNENKNGEATEAAAYAGITDEIQTITDGLIPGALSTEGQQHWFNGFWNKAIMATLVTANTKEAFVESVLRKKNKRSEWWIKLTDHLITGKRTVGGAPIKEPLSGDLQKLYAAREEVLEDIFELTRGLGQFDANGNLVGSLSRKERKALAKKVRRTFSDRLIDTHLKWALGGGAIVRKLNVGSWSKFSESEKDMRTEAIYIAAKLLQRDGTIDRNLKGISLYKHPKVIAHARLLVNNVMFSMSRANLPKAFRGIIGKVVWKFKPYTWNQIGAEWNILQAYLDEKKSKYRKESELRGFFMGMLMKPKSTAEKQMGSLFFQRMLPTLLTSAAMKVIPGMRLLNMTLNNTIGWQGMSVMGRGAESQLLKTFIGLTLTPLLFGLRGMSLAGSDEERVYEDWRRHFLPMLINILWDTFSGKDKMTTFRIYSSGFYNSIEQAKWLIKKAGGSSPEPSF